MMKNVIILQWHSTFTVHRAVHDRAHIDCLALAHKGVASELSRFAHYRACIGRCIRANVVA